VRSAFLFWAFAAVALAILAGCAPRKPLKPEQRVTGQWRCQVMAVDAKSGDAQQMQCIGADGREYDVRAK
jgi:hypothetical protein